MHSNRVSQFKQVLDAKDVFQLLLTKSTCDDPVEARNVYLDEIANTADGLDLLNRTRELALAKFDEAEDSAVSTEGSQKSQLYYDILTDIDSAIASACRAQELAEREEAKSMAYGI